ncbi:MAG: hydroxymethylbilane synthase [Omnitrophica bacterium RIFCSPHIGHO2_02_FULL_46_11]|nr:MAG: hydroxymethylbilane synthase [Omnitrophica bacterium RIFCSPLOWO2_01_FULL_45_10b]OGW87670.1 MAG: hydroxymethylbilane synthase [Omnitrophica bacterium RIFCSPHIGHO2_02_FULL_46_11]
MSIKIGTRGSKLALYQAELVRAKLKGLFPLLEFEFVKIRTKGDMIRRAAIGSLGVGVFTREIENALLENKIDIAVHSAKDLATALPNGLEITAALDREDPRDCLVARGSRTLRGLAAHARIGTGSLRRQAQLKKLRPDLEIVEMRGNVDTRLKKIQEGEYDGMVIAYAGLKRLGQTNFVTEIFDTDTMLPQAGQGIIAVQVRSSDSKIRELIRPLNHLTTFTQLSAERSFLRRIEGGCRVPAGISSKIEGDSLKLKGAIFSLTGDRAVVDTAAGSVSEAEKIGLALADKLLASGGAEILKEIRNANGNS